MNEEDEVAKPYGCNSSLRKAEVAVTSCGIGSYHPRWLQRFANPKFYVLLYSILGIIEGGYFTYTIGVLSTLEKRFAFDSKISGIFLIADNISGFFMSIVVGYYGNDLHRPRLLAMGMLVVAFSSIMSAIPYFIYGPGLHLLTSSALDASNSTNFQMCDGVSDDRCDSIFSTATVPVVTILFLANFLNGCGYTAFYTVGTAHMDDNVQKKNSPMYFSTLMTLRLFGPSLGYLTASFALNIYEQPSYDPGISTKDPRWIGAWWLGFLLLGTLLFIFTIPMLLFPRQFLLKEHHKTDSKTIAKSKSSKMPHLKDMPKALMKLAKNPLYVFRTLSIIFHLNGYMGYFLLMPRYIEAHFRQSASSASFFSGSTSIIAMAIGLMISGIVIRRFKPRPRFLTGYMVGMGSFSMIALLTVMFLACPSMKLPGKNVGNRLNLLDECNAGCSCSTRVFQPLCSADGQTTYFSPCHAGCTEFETDKNMTFFTNCKCTGSDHEAEVSGKSLADLISGYCPFDCEYFLPYIVILSVSKLISSTSSVGAFLVTLRCVKPEEKTLAIGTLNTLLAAFAFIPYPLVFGALADSTCLVFEEKCGKTGNCWVYDLDKLRYYLHGSCFILFLTGTFFDFLFFLYSNRIRNFYDDDDDAKEEEEGGEELKLNSNGVAEDGGEFASSDEDVLFDRKTTAH